MNANSQNQLQQLGNNMINSFRASSQQPQNYQMAQIGLNNLNNSQSPYQMPQQLNQSNSLLNQNPNTSIVIPGSRRIDLINQRKKEKLKNDLLNILGYQYSDQYLNNQMIQYDQIVQNLTSIVRQQLASHSSNNLQPTNQLLQSNLKSQMSIQDGLQSNIGVNKQLHAKHNQSLSLNKSVIEVPSYANNNNSQQFDIDLKNAGTPILRGSLSLERLGNQNQRNAGFSYNQGMINQINAANSESKLENETQRASQISLEVFNEWAAVIQRQDEVDERKKQEDMIRLKIRQQQYKYELDNQAQQQNQLRLGTKRQNNMSDKGMLDYLKKQDEVKTLEEEAKKQKIRQYVHEGITMSLQEKQKIESQHREKLKINNETARDTILKIQELDKQKQMQEKFQRQNEQQQYLQQLSVQEQMKKQQLSQVKSQDQVFQKEYTSQLEKQEESRQAYFNNLNKFQELNDIKLQQLSKYMNNQDLNTLSKKDEEIYLKAMQEKQLKDQRNYEDQQRNQLQTKQFQMQGLNQQLQEKNVQKQIQSMQNQKYGEEVKNQMMSQQQIDQLKQEEAKQKQKQYLEQLGQQVEESRIKKKYGALMTEHERRVHDKDIKAYESMDNHNVYNTQIPGSKSPDQTNLQDKYINRMFSNQQQNILPYAALDTSNNSGSKSYFNQGQQNQYALNNNLARKSQANKTTLQLGAESQLYNPNQHTSMDHSLLEQVKRNMERPEALRFRNNTGNKAYGFEQTLHKEIPNNMQQNSVDDSLNYHGYNYSVAGNHARHL
eukprot:403338734